MAEREQVEHPEPCERPRPSKRRWTPRPEGRVSRQDESGALRRSRFGEGVGDLLGDFSEQTGAFF